MKNKGILILIVIIVVIIAICVIANKTTTTEESSVEATSSELGTVEEYKIKYNGVDITPGTEFDEEAIQEEYEYSEIESCAFEGSDKVYKYSDLQITVAEVDGVDTVYSVYFLSESISTTEGVSLADEQEVMTETYGDDYENNVINQYIYEKGDVSLSFIVGNGYIISIEYTLNV